MYEVLESKLPIHVYNSQQNLIQIDNLSSDKCRIDSSIRTRMKMIMREHIAASLEIAIAKRHVSDIVGQCPVCHSQGSAFNRRGLNRITSRRRIQGHRETILHDFSRVPPASYFFSERVMMLNRSE